MTHRSPSSPRHLLRLSAALLITVCIPFRLPHAACADEAHHGSGANAHVAAERPTPARPTPPSWRAGVARAVITPPKLMWMSGYASRNRPAEGKLHDLWAKALVLEDGTRRYVLVTLDLVGIGRELSDRIRRQLERTHGLKRSQITLATSHTHTGPVVGRNLATMYFLDAEQKRRVAEYADFLTTRIVRAVGQAFADLAPATLHYGENHAAFAVNRRNNREADVPRLREAGQLRGPVDHSVPVLAVRRPDGSLKAIVFGYACHATVLSFYKWSGDWPGFAQLEIEHRHPGATALFVAGCGADQNPLPRRKVEYAERYGREMADAVDRALSGDLRRLTPALRFAYEEIPLAFDRLPTEAELQRDTTSDNRYIAARARALLQELRKHGRLAPAYPYPVQVVRVGELCMVVLGGEVVVDYALRLKRELAPRTAWIVAYANDVPAYIPSLRVLKEGGYEGETSMIYYGRPSRWSPNVEEHIIRTVHRLVHATD
ncbi:MAG: hypothetical protein D6725_13805 [Planctomycetota bacterium]|nr:MAG: hypothetical protein D6725_13805 [Planctomycetota bacterium]